MKKHPIKWHFNFNTFEIISASRLNIRGRILECFPYLLHAPEAKVQIKRIIKRGRYVTIKFENIEDVKLKMPEYIFKKRKLMNSKPIELFDYSISNQPSRCKNIWFTITDLGHMKVAKFNRDTFSNQNDFMVYRERMKSQLQVIGGDVYSGFINEECKSIHLYSSWMSEIDHQYKMRKIKAKRIFGYFQELAA